MSETNQGEPKRKEVKVMMMGKSELLKQVDSENGPFFALVHVLKDKVEYYPMEMNETKEYTSKESLVLKVENAEEKIEKLNVEVATILDKYQGIVVEDINNIRFPQSILTHTIESRNAHVVEDMPKNIPPMRDKIHFIYLILGSTLPNK